MIRQIAISFTAFMLISGCKAQSTSNNSKIKDKKNMERTVERFDAFTYYKNRKGWDYQFENIAQGKVLQFGGDHGSNYIEYARKKDELFGTCKEYYHKTQTLKIVGQYFHNRFDAGIWKRYGEDGFLVETTDKDAPYKNYPWEKVEKFIKKELKLDLFDKRTDVGVNRSVNTKTGIPMWYITWRIGDGKVHFVDINANTGEIMERGANDIEK